MQRKFTLSEKEIPDKWYNIIADMPNKPLPPLNPGTMEPIGPEALAPLFPMELIKQEVTMDKYVDIPDEVRNIYSMWRPTPLYRAHNYLTLSRDLNKIEQKQKITTLCLSYS